MLPIGLVAVLLAGCGLARPTESASATSTNDADRPADDAQRVAETALGKQAEILAHGNLVRNELEQVLAINRFSGVPRGSSGLGDSAPIFITRAAILQNMNGRWSEVLRCDEHLKNPNGYLGGSPSARVTSWRLEFDPDTKLGLELKFTPANSDAGEQDAGTGEPAGRSIVVRWNTRAKRYQSLDASKERYLSELPTLETPNSVLR
jgi:hypothetical protein